MTYSGEEESQEPNTVWRASEGSVSSHDLPRPEETKGNGVTRRVTLGAGTVEVGPLDMRCTSEGPASPEVGPKQEGNEDGHLHFSLPPSDLLLMSPHPTKSQPESILADTALESQPSTGRPEGERMQNNQCILDDLIYQVPPSLLISMVATLGHGKG